jgi:nucleobase:cation symporter-1, NCS1 family
VFSYYIICTYISKPVTVMIAEAVLPPQAGDISPRGSETDEYAEKTGVTLTHEKELSVV